MHFSPTSNLGFVSLLLFSPLFVIELVGDKFNFLMPVRKTGRFCLNCATNITVISYLTDNLVPAVKI